MRYYTKHNPDGSFSIKDIDGNIVFKAGNDEEGAVGYIGDSGSHAITILRLAVNAADGDYITLNGEVYELDRADDGVVTGIAVTTHTDDTPAEVGVALAAAINTSSNFFNATFVGSVGSGDAESMVVISSKGLGNDEYPVTENLSGTGNALDDVVTHSGRMPSLKRIYTDIRQPNSEEVNTGRVVFVLPFTPTIVTVNVTDSNNDTRIDFEGLHTIIDNVVVVNNAGNAADKYVHIMAIE